CSHFGLRLRRASRFNFLELVAARSLSPLMSGSDHIMFVLLNPGLNGEAIVTGELNQVAGIAMLDDESGAKIVVFVAGRTMFGEPILRRLGHRAEQEDGAVVLDFDVLWDWGAIMSRCQARGIYGLFHDAFLL